MRPLRSEPTENGLLCPLSLLNFSLLISEDFWVFLSSLSDRSVFAPSNKCAENSVAARKVKRKIRKSSLISKEIKGLQG